MLAEFIESSYSIKDIPIEGKVSLDDWIKALIDMRKEDDWYGKPGTLKTVLEVNEEGENIYHQQDTNTPMHIPIRTNATSSIKILEDGRKAILLDGESGVSGSIFNYEELIVPNLDEKEHVISFSIYVRFGGAVKLLKPLAWKKFEPILLESYTRFGKSFEAS